MTEVGFIIVASIITFTCGYVLSVLWHRRER